jgi:hypothetical protein
MKTKRDLDIFVGTNLGKSAKEVSKVTSEFIAVIKRQLIEGEEVRLDGLGVMKLGTHVMSSVSMSNLDPIGANAKDLKPAEIRNSRVKHIYVPRLCISKARSFRDKLKKENICPKI